MLIKATREAVCRSFFDRSEILAVSDDYRKFQLSYLCLDIEGREKRGHGGGDYHCSKPWGDKGEEVYLKQAVFFFCCFLFFPRIVSMFPYIS